MLSPADCLGFQGVALLSQDSVESPSNNTQEAERMISDVIDRFQNDRSEEVKSTR